MFEKLLSLPDYALPFLIVLSVLVFVHEFGHYIVGRWCGVKAVAFAIGIGPELCGYTDKRGTRWKLCLFPLGGYVQFLGDDDIASTSSKGADKLSEEERSHTLEGRPLWQRMATVAAGPLINVLYAILVIAAIFTLRGEAYTPPIVGGIVEDKPAAAAGLEPDDRILAIDGVGVETFQDIQRIITVNAGTPAVFTIARGGDVNLEPDEQESADIETLSIAVTPEVLHREDRFGFKHSMGRVGIASVEDNTALKTYPVHKALVAAVGETWDITAATFKALGQMITGLRSPEELGGILRIGAYAKQFSESGLVALSMFSAILSINLAIVNLMPIPVLDGGHLLFGLYEAIFRRPMSEKVQEYALRLGITTVVCFMLFATWNDLVQLKIVDYLVGLVT